LATTLNPSQDTRDFLDIFDALTAQFTSSHTQATSIGVNLTNLALLSERNGELFLPLTLGKTANAKRSPPP
jgi:DNA polymerase-4